MTDVHDKKTRSFNMSQIRGKDTKPEMVVRRFLFSKGFRYRVHVKSLPGNPDIVLPKYRTVIFVHGCFWHAHEGCGNFKVPKTRTEWWLKKLGQNKAKDKIAFDKLSDLNWNIITVFECGLNRKNIDLTFKNLLLSFGNTHN